MVYNIEQIQILKGHIQSKETEVSSKLPMMSSINALPKQQTSGFNQMPPLSISPYKPTKNEMEPCRTDALADQKEISKTAFKHDNGQYNSSRPLTHGRASYQFLHQLKSSDKSQNWRNQDEYDFQKRHSLQTKGHLTNDFKDSRNFQQSANTSTQNKINSDYHNESEGPLFKFLRNQDGHQTRFASSEMEIHSPQKFYEMLNNDQQNISRAKDNITKTDTSLLFDKDQEQSKMTTDCRARVESEFPQDSVSDKVATRQGSEMKVVDPPNLKTVFKKQVSQVNSANKQGKLVRKHLSKVKSNVSALIETPKSQLTQQSISKSKENLVKNLFILNLNKSQELFIEHQQSAINELIESQRSKTGPDQIATFISSSSVKSSTNRQSQSQKTLEMKQSKANKRKSAQISMRKQQYNRSIKTFGTQSKTNRRNSKQQFSITAKKSLLSQRSKEVEMQEIKPASQKQALEIDNNKSINSCDSNPYQSLRNGKEDKFELNRQKNKSHQRIKGPKLQKPQSSQQNHRVQKDLDTFNYTGSKPEEWLAGESLAHRNSIYPGGQQLQSQQQPRSSSTNNTSTFDHKFVTKKSALIGPEQRQFQNIVGTQDTKNQDSVNVEQPKTNNHGQQIPGLGLKESQNSEETTGKQGQRTVGDNTQCTTSEKSKSGNETEGESKSASKVKDRVKGNDDQREVAPSCAEKRTTNDALMILESDSKVSNSEFPTPETKEAQIIQGKINDSQIERNGKTDQIKRENVIFEVKSNQSSKSKPYIISRPILKFKQNQLQHQNRMQQTSQKALLQKQPDIGISNIRDQEKQPSTAIFIGKKPKLFGYTNNQEIGINSQLLSETQKSTEDVKEQAIKVFGSSCQIEETKWSQTDSEIQSQSISKEMQSKESTNTQEIVKQNSQIHSAVTPPKQLQLSDESQNTTQPTSLKVEQVESKPQNTFQQDDSHPLFRKSFLQDNDYVPSPNNMPFVTCKTYCIIDTKKGKLLHHKNAEEIREMASLTKIMTAVCTLELAKELQLDIYSTYFHVSERSAAIHGTSAYLLAGQMLTIYDLLYALMLPSGNDAALVLAENFSERLASKQQGCKWMDNVPQNSYKLFIKVMNQTAKKVHMRKTNYTNPHGLADKANHSTAVDLTKIANYAMKDPVFQEIVNTKEYKSTSYLSKQRVLKFQNSNISDYRQAKSLPFENVKNKEYVHYRNTWINSNKLLAFPGFSGVKTGITNTAGPCLCIHYTNEALQISLITVVMGCKTIEYRWKDTLRLTLWANSILEEQHAQINQRKQLKK